MTIQDCKSGLSFTAVIIALATWPAGCASRIAPPPVGTVAGTVTLDGEPVPSGLIRFHDQSNGGFADSLIAKPEGTYQLTFGGRSGIPAGEYLVTIDKVPPPLNSNEVLLLAPKPSSKDSSSLDNELVPKKYRDPQSSGLKANVVEGANTINFDLTSK